MHTCLGTANQARHSDAFVSASLRQSHRCASALNVKAVADLHFFMNLAIGQHREQTCTAENVADEYRGDMVDQGGKDIHFPTEHQSENFV